MLKWEDEIALVQTIADAVYQAGGRTYYVGGWVRDSLLGMEHKDIDIEVHGILAETLENILDSVGERMEFGKSFGVYGIRGNSVDIAMPRKEIRTGRGHRDFKIDIDPFCGTKQAARRRDFTINAMMQDVRTGELIDHFGGRQDLEERRIRHVCDASFGEDALRVFRAAQFAARFGFSIADETMKLCQGMDVSVLSKERVFEEMNKALMQAEEPAKFFEHLWSMNQLGAWFPEVEALLGVEQNPKHHPEGDVFVHTMQVLNRAAGYRTKAANPLGLMLSALTHDFGKPTTTKFIQEAWHSYGHEKEGVSVARRFLDRLTGEKKLCHYVLTMTEYHMKPNMLAVAKASVKATNHMFDAVPEPQDLIYLAMADSGGNKEAEPFLAERLEIYQACMAKPYVQGKDLIDAGLKPDEKFKETLVYAHKLRLAGVEKEAALKQVIGYYWSI